MNEFSIIEKFFNRSRPDDRLLRGVGDDAAVLRIPLGYDLLVSTDTLVNEVHFLPSWSPECIAKRALNVNISDIVAMAGLPHWISLALTLPTVDDVWLHRFSTALHQELNAHQMQLIGGDTTKGPLAISLTIHGLVEKNAALLRSGAKSGDGIYVSGALGAAALAVQRIAEGCDFKSLADKRLLQALQAPKARTDLIPVLRKFASSAIDISDGLAADLGHICKQSHCGATVQLSNVPVDREVKNALGESGNIFALTGGDDYELCFTVPAARQQAFLRYCVRYGLEMHQVGLITAQRSLDFINEQGQKVRLQNKGYQHFC